jgi:probable F420-dependent oxidoreductase
VWDADDRLDAATDLDELGYGALWLGSADPTLRLAEELLAATKRIVVATGIVNVWSVEAPDIAAAYQRVAGAYPDRFLLGLGNSHAPLVQALGKDYTKPLGYLAGYLDALDSVPRPVPADHRVLAALGPRALRLSADRSLGAHPYLVTPEYTRQARARLGAGPLLAPEQKVVLDTDPTSARRTARGRLRDYLKLPNYVRNLLGLGFTDEDIAGEGSDRLVDGLVAWGTPDQIAARVAEHHAAGADHVAMQVILPGIDSAARAGHPAREEWRELAAAVG